MVQETPFFEVALNLPHAGRVARRIVTLFSRREWGPEQAVEGALRVALEMVVLLDPCTDLE